MFNFADYADKSLRRPWRFAVAGSDKLVTELSSYTSYSLYCSLMAFYIDMELLTSDRILLPIIAASDFKYFCFNMHAGSYFRWLLSWGFFIPIINTTFIESSTTVYLRYSFFPRLILKLNLLTFVQELTGLL